MALAKRLLVGSAVAATALASPLNRNASPACAQVSASIATQTAPTPTVGAKVAWDCITSVPLNTTAALSLVDAVRPYIDWQSTTVWLKDPPAEYAQKVQPAIDVLGGLNAIVDSLKAGKWTQEYQVSDLNFVPFHCVER
jgi:hypothetical protein